MKQWFQRSSCRTGARVGAHSCALRRWPLSCCVCVCVHVRFLLATAFGGCLACAGVHLPLLGCWWPQSPTQIWFLAVEGAHEGAHSSLIASGAAQGPNTNLPNVFLNGILATICLGCRISHCISAHSSEFSKIFRCSRFWGFNKVARN